MEIRICANCCARRLGAVFFLGVSTLPQVEMPAGGGVPPPAEEDVDGGILQLCPCGG